MWHWARSIPPWAPIHAHPLAGFPRPLHCSRQEPLLAAQLGLGVEQGTGQGVSVPTSPSPAPSPAFGPIQPWLPLEVWLLTREPSLALT